MYDERDLEDVDFEERYREFGKKTKENLESYGEEIIELLSKVEGHKVSVEDLMEGKEPRKDRVNALNALVDLDIVHPVDRRKQKIWTSYTDENHNFVDVSDEYWRRAGEIVKEFEFQATTPDQKT